MAADHRPKLEAPHYARVPVPCGPLVPAVLAAALIVAILAGPAIGRSIESKFESGVAALPEFAIPYGGTELFIETYGCTTRAIFETHNQWTTVDFDRTKIRFEAESWTVDEYAGTGELRARAPGGYPWITYDVTDDGGRLAASLLKIHHAVSHGGVLMIVTLMTCHPEV